MSFQDPILRTLEQLYEIWIPTSKTPEEAKARLENLKKGLDEWEADGRPISVKDENGDKYYDFEYVGRLREQANRIHYQTNRPPDSPTPIPNSRYQMTPYHYLHP